MSALDLRSVALALGGDVSAGQVLAPGPGHSERDRSLSIKLDPSAPDGFLVHSHAADDWRDCRDYVRKRLGLPQWQPGDGQARTIPDRHVAKWDLAAVNEEVGRGPRVFSEDELVRIADACRIWEEGEDPRGTLAETYLRSGRKLDLPDELAGSVLRFNPRCRWRDENTGGTIFIPALIAAFRSIDDDVVTGIHRIRLDQPERWPKAKRLMRGIAYRAAVKFDDAISDTLAIGEGVETAMAAGQLGLAPVWALGSAGGISAFPVIDGIGRIIILGETGAANASAVEFCGRRWHKAGRKVSIVMPDVGSDLNDEVMAAS